MATTLNFDKLNRLEKAKAIPYRDYFGGMLISPEAMHRRIELAEEIEDVMLWVFAYWLVAAEAEIAKEELKQDAEEKLTSVIAKRTRLDPYLEKHIKQVINEVVDATDRHARKKDNEEEEQDVLDEFMDESDEDGKKEDYWTSPERAMLISENEANAFDNYIEYREAKASGKTKKTWITELDEKVRLTHTLEEGKTIDIDGLFLVGTSQMRFPKDTMYDPEANEVVNCRCVCEYS